VPFDFRQFRDAFMAHHGGFDRSAEQSDISVITEISDEKKFSPAVEQFVPRWRWQGNE
jgi:hypothetical protein